MRIPLASLAVLVVLAAGCSPGRVSELGRDAGRDAGPSPDADAGAPDAGRDAGQMDAGPVVDAGAVDGGLDAGAGASDAGWSDIPFTATGVWRTRLPASTPLDPNSTALVAAIIADKVNNYGTWSINTDSYSSPIFRVPAGAPRTDWAFNDCQGKGYLEPAFADALKGVPTTPDLLVSQGTDQEITIYDSSTDQEWEFWVAGKNAAGQWSACWGGRIDNVSTNPGIFAPPLGAVATGLPLLGFLIRIEELQRGVIPHAVGLSMVHNRSGTFSWPANRTDGNTAGPNQPLEGQRFRLDPTFDISTLPNSAERTIARAIQDYGMIITDTSGAVDLQAEDSRPYASAHGGTDPYVALFQGRPSYQVLQEIPMNRLQALPKDYGQSFMH